MGGGAHFTKVGLNSTMNISWNSYCPTMNTCIHSNVCAGSHARTHTNTHHNEIRTDVCRKATLYNSYVVLRKDTDSNNRVGKWYSHHKKYYTKHGIGKKMSSYLPEIKVHIRNQIQVQQT